MLGFFSKPAILSACILSINCLAVDCIALLKTMYQNNYDIQFTMDLSEHRTTQMEREINKNIVRVAIVGNFAYWVDNNNVYRAIIDEDGFIDRENAKEIDVFKLSKKEINKLLNIMDAINE